MKTDNVIKQERLLLQTYLVMFRKLCNLSGEAFGLKVAGITKQSISKYEAGAKDAEINIMLYIAIRQFLDYESKKANRTALQEALRLFDSYVLASATEQAAISDRFKKLTAQLEAESGKGNEDKRDKERFETVSGLKTCNPEYEPGEWYNRYQEELQELSSNAADNLIVKEREKKFIRMFCADWSAKKIAEEFNYSLSYALQIKNEIGIEDCEEHIDYLKTELKKRKEEKRKTETTSTERKKSRIW